MKFCMYCGKALEDNALCTCPGAQLAANQQAQQQAADQQPGAQQPYAPPNAYSQPNQQYNQNPYAPQGAYPPVTRAAAKTPQPGRKMIKVTGILMTIFGGIGVITGLSGIAGMDSLFGYLLGGSVVAVLVYELLAAGVMLAFGIAGINFSKSPAKGMTVVVFGIILIVLRVIDFGWAFAVFNGYNVLDDFGASLFGGMIGGLVLPILYMVGGNIRKNSSV